MRRVGANGPVRGRLYVGGIGAVDGCGAADGCAIDGCGAVHGCADGASAPSAALPSFPFGMNAWGRIRRVTHRPGVRNKHR